ncbi:MAG: magnesium/cobalt transporter CorA [Candidatus Aenigmatarchaeota archaeon]
MIESIFIAQNGKLKKIKQSDFKRTKGKVWIDILNPNKEDMEFLKKHFNFHKLALEDCVHSIQRPKLDDYGSFYFIVTHSVEFEKEKLRSVELDFFLGKNFLVTAHSEKMKCIDEAKERLEKASFILGKSPDFLLYTIMDILVDDLFPLVDRLDDEIDSIEKRIMKNPSNELINRMFHLKRNSLLLRKIIAPQRDVIAMFAKRDSSLIPSEHTIYFMDIYDHLYRICETIDTFRDMISSMMESYLTVISNRMNEIMKTLTIISTIVLPLTLIVGIYGMNFQFMPEMEWEYGYPAVLFLMLAITAVMLVYFRWRKWI